MITLVQFEIRDRIGYITLNRPEKRNALSYEFVQEIRQVFLEAEQNPDCKIIIIQANGEAFCSGADLAYLQRLQSYTDGENLNDSENLRTLFQMIYESKKTVISKVKGPALAGGCGIATICDFSFATPASQFGYTEAKIGFIPALVMVFLIRKISEKNAREILLTAEVFDASKALQYGLINDVIEDTQIDEQVHSFATKLCKTTSSQSTATIKEMLKHIQYLPLNEALDYAASMNVKARKSDDCKKGITAFLNKEKLSW